MKRPLAGALALILSIAASATTLNPIQLLNPTGSTSGQAIVSTGATTAPGWASIVNSVIAGSGITISGATGTVTLSIGSNAISLSQLSQQTANTVMANATGSTANITAFSMPSCSTSASALDWTSGTGFTCNSSINAAALSGNAIGTSGAAVPLLNGSNTWSGAQTFSSTITPSQTAGIVGTTTNNNANAGSVGEYVTATGTGISLTSGTPANCTSISLTAGDWDVWGNDEFDAGTGAVITLAVAGTTTTSGSTGSTPNRSINSSTQTATVGLNLVTPILRFSIASTTTIFLVGQANFSGGTATQTGFIAARRIR